ncbi:MAG: sigma-54-dependent Fis family transcriptional regulator [Calditrichaeota bacterium]|nr:MAG: sigma-54-dependent Fis family transcriptional regulator [Calditrichota bacterium]
MDFTILVVDDESAQLDSLAGFLIKQKYEVLKASDPKHAVVLARENLVDIVLTDYKMPGMTGVELLGEIKKINPEIDVVLMTAFGSIESATEAMKLGAFDYLTKPIDLQELLLIIRKAVERKMLIRENKQLREQLETRFRFDGIISQSSAMENVLNLAGRVAPSTASVLINGDTGTGKELIARAIHFASPRKEMPFIAVNCAALPENLLESELFGHEKGAFTGADRQRKGRFELAEGGTLFIDEIGEIPPNVQVKLLRVLQEKTFERIGGTDTIQADIRLVAATNRDLEKMAKTGEFRDDLYYRLNVVSIRIPPLRDRREDIPPLINSFIKRFADENGKSVTGMSREALDVLIKYHFPGNVRELENIVQQAVVLSRGEILTSDDLPLHVHHSHPDGDGAGDFTQGSFTERVEAFELSLIKQALRQTAGVQTRAADLLGMSERHLRYKLKKYGMK